MLLTLKKDGLYNDKNEKVANNIHIYLNEYIKLEDITLRDFVNLLYKDRKVLELIYQYTCFFKQWITFLYKLPKYTKQSKMEYSEISRTLVIDNKNELINEFVFHMVSKPLKKDEDWYKKGNRVSYGFLGTEMIREIIDLPLKFLIKNNFQIEKNKPEFNVENIVYEEKSIKLNDFIYGIFYELSFHGSPKDKDEFAGTVRDHMKKVIKDN